MKKIYYTSLFSCAGIGETFLHKLDIESALANELLGNRALWYLEKYKNTTMIPGDIMDDKVFNKLVDEHIKKQCTGCLSKSSTLLFYCKNSLLHHFLIMH